jgi:hypothetical protein
VLNLKRLETALAPATHYDNVAVHTLALRLVLALNVILSCGDNGAAVEAVPAATAISQRLVIDVPAFAVDASANAATSNRSSTQTSPPASTPCKADTPARLHIA